MTIPENVKNIGYNAFVGLGNIKRLHFNAINCTFEDRDVGTYVMPFGISVDSISFGDKVKYLNKGFFLTGYVKQHDLVFPNSLIGIGYEVFTQSDRFDNLTFGSNLKYIHGFNNLKSLKSLTILAETPPSSQGAFSCLAMSETLLYVPQESIDLYKNDTLWGKFFIVGVDGVDDVETDEEKIVIKKYYDLYGRERIYPNENEILIRVSVYDSGKTKSEKVLFNNNRTSAK